MNAATSAGAASSPENIYAGIRRLVDFALAKGMIEPLDEEYAVNSLLDLFKLAEPADLGASEASSGLPDGPMPILEPLLDAAFGLGLIPDNTTTYRDLFDARIMGMLMPRPSETNAEFRRIAGEKGVKAATDWFYKLNIDSNYIRMDRIRKNGYWLHATEYGELEITINLSKPEKDPKEIALLKTLPQANYPKCLLCRENVGYAGRVDHPARQNIRILPVELQGAQWFFQYSPYVYYNEHSIILCGEHVPMKISAATFARLLDFVESFPHYFIGSNADLPIVGGSILNHDHFQGGRHVFPMEKAGIDRWRTHNVEGAVKAAVVRWPMSVVRLRSNDRAALLRVSGSILDAWRGYSDPSAEVNAFTGETPHNTITPIARMTDAGEYEMDLVLRNNRTSEEHPDGIFHPHKELHHIKKENIGLIEVMGLAVLPGRLQDELAQIAAILTGAAPYDAGELAKADHPLAKHAPWIAELAAAHGTALEESAAQEVLRSAVGDKFRAVLADAGVYKDSEAGQAAFGRFLQAVGFGG
ncbi:UDP-glucose--hexose-1-phosphate uridylyltransferase [Cohnella thailandensis]|uniref:Galactose-1-phosphate uridylyltransferase n=1 Tax=Cohnella thailandensis TaxID=557557 RepID=A0A841T4C4_9BACL|nr:UDP-glucose--hexose-1-phosphate uridylyltransferase [Cohnella thailandensis]MBB6637849.1 UDP-glucose--hexose-1-phosphate uridylyltransferase [Cohnella thailandensis]MBP1977444.1 UDPglucose--hexose-1-phosphate uridylyltransferase [Cohnella thailandensis]